MFLMIFPLDLVDHIINETNMYANVQRERCNNLHDEKVGPFGLSFIFALLGYGFRHGTSLHAWQETLLER